MIITIDWLKSKNACTDGIERFIKLYGKQKELKEVIQGHIKDETLDYANWLITKVMTKKECIQYAVFAAKSVLNIFEKKYPDDLRPRKAIEAAESYLKSKDNIITHAAAWAAAWAADAAKAADAAAWAADAAKAANKIKIKIIRYGLNLVYKRK